MTVCESIATYGAESRSDAELLAAVLSIPVESCESMLAESEGLAGLASYDARRLAQHDGAGAAAVSRLAALRQLVARHARAEIGARVNVDRPDAVADYLRIRYAQPDQEVMGALFLNVRNEVVHERELYRGTVRRAAVEPRTMLREALTVGACGIVLFHTHPSGDPSPSVEDYAFTERAAEACKVVGVALLDHIVLGGPGRFVSMRRMGAFKG